MVTAAVAARRESRDGVSASGGGGGPRYRLSALRPTGAALSRASSTQLLRVNHVERVGPWSAPVRGRGGAPPPDVTANTNAVRRSDVVGHSDGRRRQSLFESVVTT